MRRMPLLLGTVSLICVGTVGAIVACGGDDSSDVPAPGPDGAASSSGATSSSGSTTSSSGGASSSSGAPTDGGASSSSSSGDLVSNPTQFTCGATVCDAGINSGGGGATVCCQAANETNTKCLPRNDCDNSGNNGNLRIQCDESADCVGDHAGEICCYVKQNVGAPTFTALCQSRNDCRTFQPGQGQRPRPQLCKTSAECGDAGVCNEKSCDGFKLHVCGTPEGCK